MTDTDTQLSSTQISSYSDSSSTTLQQPVAPNYVSARSADVILSEVRPTRMKSEALRSLNVLLDELLWLILGSARSFSTDRLKVGLVRVLPTILGKNALLEAEVELRAYLDRNPSAPVVPVDDLSMQKFPFQMAFELLRMKCEAYSSLGDQEENSDLENALYSRMVRAAKDVVIPHSALAPAALYLTAILEHICEHILSNVGRVVARDSSRTTAHSSDLYTALCEDESLYPLFKTMKVQDQIEQQSSLVNSKRSKSPSRGDVGAGARVASPDPPNNPKSRPSIDSIGSSSLTNRPSVDKSRTKGLFKTSLPEHKRSGDNLRRSNSLASDKRPGSGPSQESISLNDESAQDFDNLMRSGNTMKVSLTPDRLKTFEVYSKEKNLRASKPGPQNHLRDTNTPQLFTVTSSSHLSRVSNRPRNQVEAIVEAPEPDLSRSRSASVSKLPPNSSRPNTPRTRSYTEVQAAAVKPFEHQTQADTQIISNQIPTMLTAVATIDPGMPKRNRRQPARNRESLDLDDIMDGSDSELTPQPKKLALTPKSAQLTSGETRDLLEFLSEGPPEPTSPPASTSSSTTFLDGKNHKSGRFRTIVSRLTGNNTAREEPADPVLRSSINTTSRPQAPLTPKPSIPNVSARVALSQTSYPQDIPHSPTRVHNNIPTPRKGPSEWDRTRDLGETGFKRPIDPSITKSPSRSSNGRETEQLYPSTPRKPVPVYVSNNNTVEPPPPSPSRLQQDMTLTPITAKVESTPTPTPADPPSEILPLVVEDEIREFQKHIARAETVEECQILAQLLLLRCNILPKDTQKPPSPSKASPPVIYQEDAEVQVVELLLGESSHNDLPEPDEHPTSCGPSPNGTVSSPKDISDDDQSST